jgi:hypothetical protein
VFFGCNDKRLTWIGRLPHALTLCTVRAVAYSHFHGALTVVSDHDLQRLCGFGSIHWEEANTLASAAVQGVLTHSSKSTAAYLLGRCRINSLATDSAKSAWRSLAHSGLGI